MNLLPVFSRGLHNPDKGMSLFFAKLLAKEISGYDGYNPGLVRCEHVTIKKKRFPDLPR